MTCFLDTSALLAIIDADDACHKRAAAKWKALVTADEIMVCSNYILVETFALVQNRLGVQAVRTFQEDIVPLLTLEWIDSSIHQAGVTAVLTAGRRKLSLVDCTSFEIMRRNAIKSVFAFDPHFKEQGFEMVP